MEVKKVYKEIRYVVFDKTEGKWVSDDYINLDGEAVLEHDDEFFAAMMFADEKSVEETHDTHSKREFHVFKIHVRSVMEGSALVIPAEVPKTAKKRDSTRRPKQINLDDLDDDSLFFAECDDDDLV